LDFSSHSASSAAAPKSRLAVASFILGILGTTCLFVGASLVAIVLGHVAISQIRNSQGALSGRGFAIAGLVLGYVIVIATLIASIVLLLIGLLG
jgi:hypothetical protein